MTQDVLVLYGSETGNAQEMAEELGRTCRRLRYNINVAEMNTVDLTTLLQHDLVIFVVSTTGQGDMPHNSLLFWKRLLRKKLAPSCLSNLRYTTFGLGDSTYLKFNWAARKLNKRLDQLGATAFFEHGEADEQFPDGIDGSFIRWAQSLRQFLTTEYPHPEGLEPLGDEIMLPPQWSLEPALQDSTPNGSANSLEPERSLNGHGSHADLLPIPGSWQAQLTTSERLTPETHWQDVRLMTFDIESRQGSLLHCNPGDCLTVHPKNFPEDVQKLITLMKWDAVADRPLHLSRCASLPSGLHAHRNCTIRELLLSHIDINAIPRRSFLKSMSYYSTDPYHKERLLEFTMAEYLDEYFDYATRARRTIIEVLEEFTSVVIPASHILDVFPLIRGRDFSIANGGASLRHPTNPDVTRVQLLVALVKYRTILRKPREGLCSRYLASLVPETSVLTVTHKPVLSAIHGSANSARHLVGMATGTGIAPVRSLIQERLTHLNPAPMLLFFGSRNVAADYFFREEWEVLQEQGRLTVYTAFSRDQRDKIYVQDIIRREHARVEQAVSENGIFTVCGGSSRMADACKTAVFDPMVDKGQGNSKEELMANVTWWQEIW